SESTAREAITILTRRLQHKNVNVVLYTLTVANALVQNCGLKVHQEISSRAFCDALVKLVSNRSIHEIVRSRILDLIQQWAEAFKSNSSLGFMVDTYNQLKSQDYSFPSTNKKPDTVRAQSAIDKDKEEEELQLAMALSLSAQENAKKAAKAKKSSSSSAAAPQPSGPKVICQVRALYDFAGLEEGELRMRRGDVVDVYDNTTFKDWWKGGYGGKVGIFPSNYVEKVEDGLVSSGGSGPIAAKNLSDEQKVDEFVGLLARMDPARENFSENERVQELYNAILLLRPKVVKDIEQRKARYDELAILNERFTAACGTYHKLMEASLAAQRSAYQQPPPGAYYGPPGAQPYTQPPTAYPQQQYQGHQQPAGYQQGYAGQ
ncbi:ESCRT-0 subunit protein hse1, partial [Blyttiomyces sp. JEL0837]